jgi:hypothetical protein
MAIAQDSFDLFRGRAYDGQVSTIDVADIISRLVEGEFIPFGRAVIRGVENRSCAPVDAGISASDVIGFSVRTMAEASPTPPNNDNVYAIGYPVNHVASLLRRGRMFAVCVDGAVAGESVHVVLDDGDSLGRLTSSAGAGSLLELNQVKWTENIAAGEIGEFQVDGIMHVSSGSAGE